MPLHSNGPFDTVETSVVAQLGVLTPAECDIIIGHNRALTTEEVPEHGGGHVRAHPIDDIADLCGVEARLYAALRDLNQALDWRIPLDIARFGCSGYLVGDSMGAHVDDEERGAPPWDLPHRGISFSLQLSDPDTYEGGELRILHEDQWTTVSANRGDLIAFGSSTPHQVTEVTAGERWVLLGWGYCNHDLRDIR